MSTDSLSLPVSSAGWCPSLTTTPREASRSTPGGDEPAPPSAPLPPTKAARASPCEALPRRTWAVVLPVTLMYGGVLLGTIFDVSVADDAIRARQPGWPRYTIPLSLSVCCVALHSSALWAGGLLKGPHADRNLRMAVAAAAVAMAAGFAVAGVAVRTGQLWLFLVGWGGLHGTGYGIAMIVNNTHAVQWFRPYSGLGATVVGLASGISVEFLIYAQEGLIDAVGVETCFYCVALIFLMCITMVPIFRFPPKEEQRQALLPGAAQEPAMTRMQCARTPQVWFIGFAIFACALPMWGAQGNFTSMAQAVSSGAGQPLSHASAVRLQAVLSIPLLLGRSLGGALGDAMGVARSMLVFLAVEAALCLALPSLAESGHVTLYFIALGLVLFFGMAVNTQPASAAMWAYGPRDCNTATGLCFFFKGPASIIGPMVPFVIGGGEHAPDSSYFTFFYITGAVTLCGALSMCFFRQREAGKGATASGGGASDAAACPVRRRCASPVAHPHPQLAGPGDVPPPIGGGDAVTARVAAFITGAGVEGVPDVVAARARRVLADTIGVMRAGASHPAVRMLADHVRGLGEAPRCTVVGHGFRAGPCSAAFVNGSAAHVLDFDDTWHPATHACSPMLPAVLALAEDTGAAGEDIFAAFLVGIEVQGRLRLASRDTAIPTVFHPPSTVGAMGAAAACARLLRLRDGQTRHALGIAATRAGGLMANAGTETKCTHSGHAARVGVEAALLAKRGFTASDRVFDRAIRGGPGGYVEAFAPDLDPSLMAGFGQPHYLQEQDFAIKRWPSHLATHWAITAALELRTQIAAHGGWRSVRRLHIEGPVKPYIYRAHPATHLDAKFSLQYTACAALIDGDIGFDTFSEARVHAEDTQALLGAVDVWCNPDMPPSFSGMWVTLTATMGDGTTHTARCTSWKGHWSSPMSDDEIRAKLAMCLAYSRDGVDHAMVQEEVDGVMAWCASTPGAAGLMRLVA